MSEIRTSDGLVVKRVALFLGASVSAVGRVTEITAGHYRGFESSSTPDQNVAPGSWVELWPNNLVLRSDEAGYRDWHWTFSYQTRASAISAMKSRGQVGPFTKKGS